jgi:hypothetical protein
MEPSRSLLKSISYWPNVVGNFTFRFPDFSRFRYGDIDLNILFGDRKINRVASKPKNEDYKPNPKEEKEGETNNKPKKHEKETVFLRLN